MKQGHTQIVSFRISLHQPCIAVQTSLSQPCLAVQTSLSQPCLAVQTSLSQPCLAVQTSLNQPCLAVQTSLSQPCLLYVYILLFFRLLYQLEQTFLFNLLPEDYMVTSYRALLQKNKLTLIENLAKYYFQ